MNQKKCANIKKLHEKLLISENCGEIYTPKLKRETFCYNSIQETVETTDKRS